MNNIIDITHELSQNFLDFSHEANVQRAFADARDGLKPGQRACLWEMYSKGYTSNKPHVKSAKISGGTIASWWPHSNTAIYDTFTRMSQAWINNLPEVDWHGSNGSIQISGEAAAERYCVVGDTLIKTNKGTIPIRELVEFAEDDGETLNDIFIIDFQGNEIPATKIFNSGLHTTKTITLKNGLKLTGTLNHPIVVLNKKDCGFTWKTIEELTLDDKAIIPLFNYTQDTDPIDTSSGDIEYKMLGAMLSEGYITTQNRIGINNKNIDMIQPVYEFFTNIYHNTANINYNSKRDYYEYCIANKEFYNKFIEDYEYQKSAKDKFIPKRVLQTTNENKSAFLRYLFEGDGSIFKDGNSYRIVYSSYSEKLINQLQIMLIQDFSIFSYISSRQRETGIEYKLYVSGRGLVQYKQKINFLSNQKKELLCEAVKQFEFQSTINSNSYYLIPEITQYVRTLNKNKYVKSHGFSNIKNFYLCQDYIDNYNFNRLQNLLYNYLPVSISSIITNENKEEVYSVKVENPSSEHSYVANGFINHNTEARLSKAVEEGMLFNIKKHTVPMKLNFSEDEEWPEVFPALYPRLMINGCQGIGSTIANHWTLYNLRDLYKVIYEYIKHRNLDYSELYPDYPTGGIIINKNDLSVIHRTGKGRVVLRAKTEIKGNHILITEIPYQVYVEPLIEQIKDLINKDELSGIENIYNKSDKKRLLIDIECEKNPDVILNQLFKSTNLQKIYNPNQYALVNHIPKLLTLQEYLDIYIEHNYSCIKNEYQFDLNKAKARLEVVEGLIKALEDIDNIIALIKQSQSSSAAVSNLINTYQFTENQAKAIVNMKLGSLAKLEKIELNQEITSLTSTINDCNDIIQNTERQADIFIDRLNKFVNKYGHERKTEVIQVTITKEDKEIEHIEPEKCVVVMTEAGTIKRIPITAFKTQKRGGKGVKTQEDIVSAIIRTNTVDSLMIFTDKGQMYRLLVNDIPEGTNTSRGVSVHTLTPMAANEKPVVIYSIYRDTDAQYVLFATKNGILKKTSLDEYVNTRKKCGIGAIKFKDNDELASVCLIKDEQLMLFTAKGYVIRFNSNEITTTSRMTSGIKGINLGKDDYIVAALPIRDLNDDVAIFTANGMGKIVKLSDFPLQKRAGKGIIGYKFAKPDDVLIGAQFVNENDTILLMGNKSSICIKANDISDASRTSLGVIVYKGGTLKTISKV